MWFIVSGAIDPDQIIGFLFPTSIWPVIIQLISTLVLIFVMTRFFYKPVKAILDKRAITINTQIKESLMREKKSKELLDKVEVEYQASKLKSQQLIMEAQEQIEKNRVKAIQEASEQASLMKQKANQDIALAQAKALDEIEKEIIGVAIDASQKILQREINPKDHEKIIQDFLKERRS